MPYPEPAFMEELHQIRKEHYEATKHLSAEEQVRLTNENARRFLEELGYELVPSPTGLGLRIVRRGERVAGGGSSV